MRKLMLVTSLSLMTAVGSACATKKYVNSRKKCPTASPVSQVTRVTGNKSKNGVRLKLKYVNVA